MIQHHFVGFPADARLLVAAKGGMGRIGVIAVHPHPAGLNAPGHAIGAVHIPGPDARPQAKLGVVGNGQRVGLVLEGGNSHRRTKDLFLKHPHVIAALENGGLNIKAVFQPADGVGLSAQQHLCPFRAANFHVAENFVELLP